MSETLTYKLQTDMQTFEGPLDLLLHLIAKNKMDIFQIQITVIFAQYMQYLDQMRQMNMEIAGEFIVMASELMYIKSRMLLPRPEEETEDPRERLAQALLEYKRAKREAGYLEERYVCYSRRTVKDVSEIPPDDNTPVLPQDIAKLQEAIARILARLERKKESPVTKITPLLERKLVSVTDKMTDIMSRLQRVPCCVFEDLFADAQTMSEVVALFIAVLSLIKDGHVHLERQIVPTGSLPDASETHTEDETVRYRYVCSLGDAASEPFTPDTDQAADDVGVTESRKDDQIVECKR